MKVKSLLSVAALLAIFLIGDIFVPETYGAPRNNYRNRRDSARNSRSTPEKVMTRFITVTVEGSGETLALAQKNAKDNALTEVVGRALKGKTKILENGDKVKITREFLAASAGYISSYKELSRKNENNVFVVKAEVIVYQDKLYEAVVFGGSKEEEGEFELGGDEEILREEMTRYIVAYMVDYCRIWKIQAKQIIPEHDSDGKPILHVNFYYGTTPQLYNMYLKRLRQAMAKINARENYGKNHNEFWPLKIVTNPGAKSPSWTSFMLPKKYLEEEHVFDREIEKYGYKLTVELLSAENEVIYSEVIGETFYFYNDTPIPRVRYGLVLEPLRGEGKKSSFRCKFTMSFNNFADRSEMLKVKKVRAKLEPVKKVREKGLQFKQYSFKWGWYE